MLEHQRQHLVVPTMKNNDMGCLDPDDPSHVEVYDRAFLEEAPEYPGRFPTQGVSVRVENYV